MVSFHSTYSMIKLNEGYASYYKITNGPGDTTPLNRIPVQSMVESVWGVRENFYVKNLHFPYTDLYPNVILYHIYCINHMFLLSIKYIQRNVFVMKKTYAKNIWMLTPLAYIMFCNRQM